jgi:hypothetical protein
MSYSAVKTTQIEIEESTIELSQIQSEYIEQSITRGLEDIETGNYSSDPIEIDKNIMQRFEALKKANKTAG